MPSNDSMTIDERRKYLRRLWPQYRKAHQPEKSRLLDQMAVATELHRKSLIRLLGQKTLARAPRAKQRGVVYGPAVRLVVVVVWESLDYVCAERLRPVLLPTARQLARFGEVQLTPAVEGQLGRISVGTVRGILRRQPRERPRVARGTTAQAHALRQTIPMGRLAWDEQEPGHFEVDLVHHCGATMAGEYLHTLQMVDIATGWSERVVVPNRGFAAMAAGFRRILARLPFPVRSLHPDNGSEFLNDQLVRFFGQAIPGLRLTRSRPYQKNDNRNVEQRNYTQVRQYFGDARLEGEALAGEMNEVYDQMWIHYNLFQPVLHLVGKTVVEGRLKRTWDAAQPPYQRLLAAVGRAEATTPGTGGILLPPEVAARLAALAGRTNPRALHTAILAGVGRVLDQAAGRAVAA